MGIKNQKIQVTGLLQFFNVASICIKKNEQ